MLVYDYLKTLACPIGRRTLCFLTNKTGMVLLGKKKRGLGEGNYLGIGGKVEGREEIEEAVVREMQEEVGVIPVNPEKMAVVTFLFPEKPNWNQEVHVFRANSWTGEPKETDEIIPRWFKIKEIPYALMWDDNKYWLPKILEGNKVRGYFLFKGLKVCDSKISLLQNP